MTHQNGTGHQHDRQDQQDQHGPQAHQSQRDHQGHQGHQGRQDQHDQHDQQDRRDRAGAPGPGHSTAHRGGGRGGWAMAAQATLHCLTGCAIGEVLGMVAGTAFGWGNAPTTLLAIVLAFFFGYLLTLRGVLGAGAGLRAAVRVALAADTVSIAVMELVDNGTIALWPAAMDAGLADALFWVSLAVSLVVAFVITTPVNRWMISRGRGHAVAHRYHH